MNDLLTITEVGQQRLIIITAVRFLACKNQIQLVTRAVLVFATERKKQCRPPPAIAEGTSGVNTTIPSFKKYVKPTNDE